VYSTTGKVNPFWLHDGAAKTVPSLHSHASQSEAGRSAGGLIVDFLVLVFANVPMKRSPVWRSKIESQGFRSTTEPRTAVLLGKILESIPSPARPVPVPPSNPFVGTDGFRPEIWDLGLRNPWGFNFDRQTGDLFIGDVGEDKYEEIDYQPASGPAGLNFGCM